MTILTPSKRVTPLPATERNEGRGLLVVIESGDRSDYGHLSSLARLAKDWVENLGYDTTGWPSAMRPVIDGSEATRRWERRDHQGDVHSFGLVEFADFDTLFAVSSRRVKNVGSERSGNLASNVILELLETAGQVAPRRYGRLMANVASRIFRNIPGGNMVIDECREWHIQIRCKDFTFDPAIDPTPPYAAVISVIQNAEGATATIVNGSNHKVEAHRAGVCKWARAVTTPIVAVHPVTKVMTWDPEVCEALRDAVRLKRKGTTWADIALSVGGRIPAYRLRAEPDTLPEDAPQKVRSRERRNEQRRLTGREQVPFQFLVTGAPNPNARGETLLDVVTPTGSIITLLLHGGISKDRRERLRIKEDLDGLDPSDMVTELLRTGVFRRLVKDQAASNRSMNRYRYVSYQLPPYEIGPDGKDVYVLTDDEVGFLRGCRSAAAGGTGPSGSLPMVGLFAPNQKADVYTESGLLRQGRDHIELVQEDGRVVAGRYTWNAGWAANLPSGRCYRLRFESVGTRRRGTKIATVGLVDADVFNGAVIDAVTSALRGRADTELVHVHLDSFGDPVADARLRALEEALKAAQGRLDGATESLMSSDLTPLVRENLHQKAAEAESAVNKAKEDLEKERAATAASRQERVPMDSLVDVFAVVATSTTMSARMARAVQVKLSTFLKSGRISVVSDGTEIEWSADLELRAESGRYLRIPIGARLSNASSDAWIAGPAGLVWRERRSLLNALVVTGRDPAQSRVWQRRLERRLAAEADYRGRSFRGPNAVNLFVRCPHDQVVDAGLSIIFGEERSDLRPDVLAEVTSLFFTDKGDLPPPRAADWRREGAWGAPTARLRRLLAMG